MTTSDDERFGGDSDDELAARLGRLLGEMDPVPDQVVEAAGASLGWRALDTQLARLVAESLETAGAVRGGGVWLLTFEADGLTLEIEVSRSGDRLRIVGQVVPPRSARLRAEQPGTTTEATADELGRFSMPDLPAGPTRFTCTAPGVNITTEWTLLR
ncbi:carboxypeptidase-like regulatory domain-containing protein [Actinoplanes sp. NPDC051411]|uniref:carboxypeptidase-like regulatory domain-containing protein n=1 Tax=Actinoplanes sp. NPDC051411 TaxID=3155522 RepID=UPI003413814A